MTIIIVWVLVYVCYKFAKIHTFIHLFKGELVRLAAWHLPGGPVGLPVRWADTSKQSLASKWCHVQSRDSKQLWSLAVGKPVVRN